MPTSEVVWLVKISLQRVEWWGSRLERLSELWCWLLQLVAAKNLSECLSKQMEVLSLRSQTEERKNVK
ncbi:hypothetical protein JHK87_034021 [Glycine soja]|nr:hypothetical protein JHK87_034021 [Glycine soja]